MRRVVKRRIIWIGLVSLIVWLLALAFLEIFLPSIDDVSGSDSSQAIRDSLTSGVVLGTLLVIVIVIVWIIIIDEIIEHRRGN